ncbi:hypothetical protein ACTM8Z_04690, partial [Atopobiaceae bacterium HCP3S3_D6]
WPTASSYDACLRKHHRRTAVGHFTCSGGVALGVKIRQLKRNRAFTKAVSNMAIMDITDIEPLLMAVYELLQESGIFVFATQHPCFVTLTEKYMTPHSYYDIAIEGQPKEQIYYHRSIQDIFNLCFRAGFVIDGFYEECFKTNKEIPMVMIVRLKKVKRDNLKLIQVCRINSKPSRASGRRRIRAAARLCW